MTWYWWTHWFWITAFGVITSTLTNASVETYPVSPTDELKEYTHKKDTKIPLKFPLAAQSDDDDVIAGSENIPPKLLLAVNNSDRNALDLKDTHHNNNNNNTSKIVDNIFVDKTTAAAVNETGKLLLISDQNERKLTDSIGEKKQITDFSIGNNNFSSVSTNSSSAAIIMNASNMTVLDALKRQENDNHTVKGNELKTQYENHNITSTESLEDDLTGGNSTPATEIDLVDDLNVPHKIPVTLENVTKEEELIRAQNEQRTRKSKVLSEYRHELGYINFSSDAKNLLARSAAVSLEFDEQDEGNVSSEALSVQRAYLLDAGTISAICFAVLGIFCGVSIAGVFLYRRRFLNKPQTLSEPDSSGYIDDSTIRTIFILQDNSDEMYSLDNDSFLNSLEAMTIQNYWTDTVKHTKL